MGGDHGYGHGPPKVPDYTTYKVEECPKLIELRDKLAKKGLKDPWIRNEVWRFHPSFRGSLTRNIMHFFFRGFRAGFAAFLVTIAVENFVLDKKPDHGHEQPAAH